ncbi:MAG: pilus assembly protein PilM [Candidatus Omnitrophica bacterium]|nr:pilus assembly protein PilM [Candidatus Omnitrophota bacterium]
MSLLDRSKSVALIQIGRNFLKLMSLRCSSREVEVVRVSRRNLTQDSGPLKTLLEEWEIHADKVILVISRDQVLLRNLELPSTDLEEITEIVSLQADKQTPFSRDEITAGFRVLSSSKEHYTHILLAVIQKEIIQNVTKALPVPLSKIERICLDTECLSNWDPVLRSKLDTRTYALLDLEQDRMDFCVCSEGKLLFSRLVPFKSSREWSPEVERQVTEEIRLCLEAYKNEELGPEIREAVLMGARVAKERLAKICRERFLIKPVCFSEEAASELTYSEQVERYLEREMKEDGSSSKLMGLALNLNAELMDFVPAEMGRIRRKQRQAKEMMLTGVLSAALLLCAGAVIGSESFYKYKYNNDLGQELHRLESTATILRRYKQRLGVIRERVDLKGSALEGLYQIHRAVPQEMYLTGIQFDWGDGFSIRGTASSTPPVFEMVRDLEKLPEFQNVKTKYVTRRRIENMELTDFEVNCPLSP